MKDIDFLPEWYKSGRRRQISYRTQYFILGGIFAVMIVWNFVASYSVSKAKAQILEMATRQTQAENVSNKLNELKNEMNLFHKKEILMEKIESRINVAGVLGELSYLINERVVLSKIELLAERFPDNQDMESSQYANAVVRSVQSNFNTQKEFPVGNIRFKVQIAGVAADAGDVAALICKLENSPYFNQVVLSFSRNTDLETAINYAPDLKTGPASQSVSSAGNETGSRGKIQVSKFEIGCYLANYIEE
ncbi:MAG: PilN domain-containing protein [Sedimentisphaerales bacterium]|nr:PilN domain-containing protein [Sedimentisphaerales bacterium]